MPKPLTLGSALLALQNIEILSRLSRHVPVTGLPNRSFCPGAPCPAARPPKLPSLTACQTCVTWPNSLKLMHFGLPGDNTREFSADTVGGAEARSAMAACAWRALAPCRRLFLVPSLKALGGKHLVPSDSSVLPHGMPAGAASRRLEKRQGESGKVAAICALLP